MALLESTLGAILSEVDTLERLRTLIELLEQAIGFLGALGASETGGGGCGGTSGGGGGGGDVRLADYALRAMLLTREAWEAAATPTIERQVCLCHLQSLFLALEDGAAGVSVEQQVSPRYAEPLPAELEAELSEPRLPPSELLPALHDLMRGQLTEASWPAEASLKQYLGFAAEQELEDAEWWPLFPEGLQLRHALATFRHLKGR